MGIGNLLRRFSAQNPSYNNVENLTSMQRWFLGFIYEKSEHGDVFQKDLEAAFKIRRSTTTGILQIMEKSGYIIRKSISYDARLKKLVLTPKAFSSYKMIEEGLRKSENDVTKGFTPEEIKTLGYLLEKVERNIL